VADDSFKGFVLDQLAALPELRAKAMFGAHGLYSGDRFFAILDAGRLFFKVNAETRGDYESRGMGPFTYESNGRVMTMGYYEVPPDVLENPQEAVAWAQRAIQVAAAGRGDSAEATGGATGCKRGKTPSARRSTGTGRSSSGRRR
jgi:DNA transformation protein